LGLSSTINRELARSAVASDSDSRTRDLVRTLELVYWGIGIVLGAFVVVLAPLIGERWVHADHISKQALVSTVRLMGIVLAAQWPASLYAGGLLGLRRQVTANLIMALTAALRFGGAALVLWKVSRTCQAFFVWQAVASALSTAVLAVALWLQPELRGMAAVRWPLLREVWKYATGVAGISIVAVVLTQMDKLMLSKLVSLKAFAYYGLASQLAGSLNYVVSPFMTGIFPALCAAASEKSDEKLRKIFHDGASLVGGAAIPVVVFFVLFARDILYAWQRDATTAAQAGPTLAILSAAGVFNAVLNMPYYLMLAKGDTRVPFVTNVISLLVLVPLLVVSVPRWGVDGAAFSWLIVNAITLVVFPFVVFRGALRQDKWPWYSYGVFWPTLCATAPLLFMRLVVLPVNRPAGILGLLIAAAVGSLTGLFSAAPARQWMLRRFAGDVR